MKLTLNPETQKLICDRLHAGCYLEAAALDAGIPKRTVRHWLSLGRDFRSYCEEHECDPHPRDAPYISFVEAVEEASAKAEVSALARLRKGEAGWQAQAWFLERRFPERWGRHTIIDTSSVTPPEGAETLDDVRAQLAEKDIAEVEAQLRVLLSKGDEEAPSNGSSANGDQGHAKPD